LNREQSLSLDSPNRPDPPAALATAPDQSALSRERAEQVTGAVDRLPAYYKQVIEFRHRYQLQFSEIALLLGKSEVAIRRAWARGLEKLRHDIEHPAPPCPADCRPIDPEPL
jgi:RNA polymerase sigma factor (sigma-70 family)